MPRNHPHRAIPPGWVLSLASPIPLVCPRPSLSASPVLSFVFCLSLVFVSRRLLYLISSILALCITNLSPLLSFSLSVTITPPDLIILHSRDIPFSEQKSLTERRLHRQCMVSHPSESIGFRSLSNMTYGPSDQSCFKIWTGFWRANRVIVLEVVWNFMPNLSTLSLALTLCRGGKSHADKIATHRQN